MGSKVPIGGQTYKVIRNGLTKDVLTEALDIEVDNTSGSSSLETTIKKQRKKNKKNKKKRRRIK